MKTVVVTDSIGFFSQIEFVASGSAWVGYHDNYIQQILCEGQLNSKKERKNEGRKQVGKKERVRSECDIS